MLITYVSIGSLSIIKKRLSHLPAKVSSDLRGLENKTLDFKVSFSRKSDLILLMFIIAFYLMTYLSIYPEYVTSRGSDLSRHWWFSNQLSRTPDVYGSHQYVLFHCYIAAVYYMAGKPGLITYLSALELLDFLTPLTFYAMVKRYLEKVDKKLPIISTIFLSLFSNFAWIYYMKIKLENKLPAYKIFIE